MRKITEKNGKKWKKAESSGSTESTEAPIVYSGGTGRDGVDTGKNAVVKDTTIWGFVGIGIPVAGLIAAAIFMFLKIRKLEELLMGKK